jgi:hypothetical protein
VEAHAYFPPRIAYSSPHYQPRDAAEIKLKTVGDDFALVLANVTTVSVDRYDGLIDGLDGELADGATFVTQDGCTVTRHGDEVVWTEPLQPTSVTLSSTMMET